MNIFAHTIMFMSYALGMSIFLIGESNGFEQTTIEIEKCSFEQVNQTQFQYSSFIEQITQHPLVLHASEPIRLSIKTTMTEREANELTGTWITLRLLQDASICFAPDHKKTQEMQRQSEHLHKRLQERIYEGNG